MKITQKFVGLCLVISTDVGLGLLACCVILNTSGLSACKPGLEGIFCNCKYYAACAIFSLLPDILDLFFVEREFSSNHRGSVNHQPIYAVIVCALVGKCSPLWGLMLFTCVFLHYIHDSIEGPGIPWLAPFLRQQFSLRLPKDGGLIKSWTAEELENFDIPLWAWIDKAYFHVTPNLVFGLLALSAALPSLWLWP